MYTSYAIPGSAEWSQAEVNMIYGNRIDCLFKIGFTKTNKTRGISTRQSPGHVSETASENLLSLYSV